jgi:nucleotide-binding universal stress UspA family protein
MTVGQHTVVVGYDGSEPSRAAIAHAVGTNQHVNVVIVHAREPLRPHPTSRWRELLDAHGEEHAQAVLDAIVREEAGVLAGVSWEARLASGRPADAILEVAREVRADAIVVGSHGYRPDTTAVLGSVSGELLRRADVPVTVIPPGATP